MSQEEVDIIEEADVVENLKQSTLVTVIQQGGDCTNLNCFFNFCLLHGWCGKERHTHKEKVDRAVKVFIDGWGRDELLKRLV